MNNKKFRSLFDSYLKRSELSQEKLAWRLYTCRQTVHNRLYSFTPIDFSFVVQTAALFELSAVEIVEYFESAGYSVAAKDVPAMGVVFDLMQVPSAGVREMNEILRKYKINAIR